MINITFKERICPNCAAANQNAVKKANGYYLYCAKCTAFIGKCNASETTIIKARENWLEDQLKKKSSKTYGSMI